MPQLKHVRLEGSERAAMPGAHAVAVTNPNEEMQVTVMVRPRKELPAANWQHTHYMNREEFLASHAADPADLAKVEAFARDNQLDIVEADAARRSVKLRGAAAAFTNAFQVELKQYALDGGTYRGREGAVNIPESLAGIVEGVFGLDNRPAAEPHCGMNPTAAAVAAAAGPAAPALDLAPQVGGTFTPPQLARLYNFPSSLTGAGQTIAIIELGGGINNADLTPYFQSLGLPTPAISTVSVDGGQNTPNQNDNNATLEVMLDIEVAGAIAPQAKQVVYFAPNTFQSFINAVSAAVHDTANNPSVISISWGASEDSWSANARQAMDSALQAAAMLGITVCTASGDNGSADHVSDGRQHVDFPSASPNALACGGTSLTGSGTTITSEVAWNNGPGAISGGGISDAFPVPSYQAAANLPPSANPGAGPGRGVPDVSGHAASYQLRFFGQTISAFGTSAVAPLWAGLIALVNQSIAPRRVGLAQTKLYASPAGFHDITNGTNGSYSARVGWDACTGLGSPKSIQTVLGATIASVPITGLVHLQNIGDVPLVSDVFAGTRGQSRRLEGFLLQFHPPVPGLSMRYMAHLQGIGDVPFQNEGTYIGTRGQSRRLEGFAIQLTGPEAGNYTISYMAHLQGTGDTAFFRDGAFCGTRGQSRRVEGILVHVQKR